MRWDRYDQYTEPYQPDPYKPNPYKPAPQEGYGAQVDSYGGAYDDAAKGYARY